MIILSIKTDQKTAEAGLFDSHKKLEYTKWQAHRELSVTIHNKIENLLQAQNLSWQEIEGIVFYEGPGSFTGLRIGASVANALSSELNIPIAETGGPGWIQDGVKNLRTMPKQRSVIPKYGSEPATIKPKK